MNRRRVIVVGAGPAGLAAAWELVNAEQDVTVLEGDPQYVGGLARTMNFNGFRFDIGAHRFFSKNIEIRQWWRERLKQDFVRVQRLTRIFYRGRFFHYPLHVREALFGLGLPTSCACIASYLWRRLLPIRLEKSFADWVTNRFGDRLYRIFFKTYTEKVWGMRCSDISADWASQRIKGLSLWEAARNALLGKKQKSAKTLVDEFEYPRLGAGMMWEEARDEVVAKGGRIYMGRKVVKFERIGGRIVSAVTDSSTRTEVWSGDEFIVSMPLQDCVLNIDPPLEPEARNAAKRLAYRDFILVVLIVRRRNVFPDQWIYVHAPEVKVARVENYSNWGANMSPNPNLTCLSLEYFCSRGDSLWQMADSDLASLAQNELEQLGLARPREIKDACVVRVEKAYPVYDAFYRRNVDIIRKALSGVENLQVAGRNAMHKYNNQDHSMLAGFFAARNVTGRNYDVWRINTDAEYLEAGVENEGSGRLVPRLRNQ